ncbi:zinc finger protein 395b isoform X2 [Notolabrus celidotus]|nr:zinc finger protein 395b isoform X2 [Notolabrus celidotus]XP_034554996.1 zinc finger protein 395b isoform X2 [Notolabrus celidotus]XP_034554997.1 zinc finger protein 395b isoform X2 [Notolabrus celidotus]XP_034554998.1 zinc finger protein 395b isoform X2 [Notolabrus celidotus]XP_034554999.1 zinc finger protein 395b isoform X2 [Notolabrus celidotus]
MAAMGPDDKGGAKEGGTAVCPSGLQGRISATSHNSSGPDRQKNMVCTQSRVQPEKAFLERGHQKNKTLVSLTQREMDQGWSNLAAPLKAMGHAVHISNPAATREAPYSFRSPDSVEMDEIMAAMVLTSLSCSPVVQSPPRTDPGTGGSSSSADMECGGGELSDSGSSGYWSWDHGNVSPAPSPSVTEMDSSPDEGLHMELEQGEELNAKKPKSSFRGVYRCLWPSCGKVLTSSVGIKRHIRVLHLGSGSDQSQREEDFYYTKISCEAADTSSTAAPPQPVLSQASSTHLSWASCGSPSASEIQISPAYRPRSNSSSGPGVSQPSPLSQSAPSSFWQIHSEHLYQACSPVQVPVASRSPGCQVWTPSAPISSHSNTPLVKPRCRSVSVGEQWLQQNRLQPMTVSPSRNHCSFRKGRGEAKKCRKVYGIERKDQWCTACRWKKACQRFPD